jgi:hypothetical protein
MGAINPRVSLFFTGEVVVFWSEVGIIYGTPRAEEQLILRFTLALFAFMQSKVEDFFIFYHKLIYLTKSLPSKMILLKVTTFGFGIKCT